MSRIVHLDGRLLPEAEARISPFDRGFLLGDAVFETLRIYDGRPFCLEEHVARLTRSLEEARLGETPDLGRLIDETVSANGLRDAMARITVSRGPGGRGASPIGAGPRTVLVTATPVHHPAVTYERGLSLITSTRRRVAREALDPGLKTTNYLVHVLARIEAEEAGADDALFVDDDAFVVEATQANVFACFGHELVTPPLSSGCLPGVARAVVLDLAREVDLEPAERPLSLEALSRADETFLTASVLEVAPVVRVDGTAIGDGQPGAHTKRLHALYRKRAMQLP